MRKKDQLFFKKHIPLENKENLSFKDPAKLTKNSNNNLYFQKIYPFISIPLEKDPLNQPSYNFIDPPICIQPYLTETTILDKSLPKMNIFCESDFIKAKNGNKTKNMEENVKYHKRIEKNIEEIDNFYKINKKPEFQEDIYNKLENKIDEIDESTILFNGTQVNINRIFEESDCKKSEFLQYNLPDSLTNTRKLSDFQIGKLLGKGRFGTVLLVKEIATNAIFALKMINKELAKQENVYHLIRREAMIHESLNHPNILKCYGSFEDDERFYLILEYTPDGDLYKNLRAQENKKFTEEKASNIIYQILLSLVYLNDKNILHRDIKAENILVFMGSVYKLSDFGWAICNNEHLPRNTFCGTIEYIAPEMIMHESYNESIDLWAVAVLTYELVMGEPPFQSSSNIETFNLILDVNFKMPEFFSMELKNFIGRILRKDYNQRMSLQETINHPFIMKYNKYEEKTEESKFGGIL